MIIDINSIKINGVAVADKLTEAVYSFNKLRVGRFPEILMAHLKEYSQKLNLLLNQ